MASPADVISDSLRILVAGCGSIGRRHARNLKALGLGSVLIYDAAETCRALAGRELGFPVVGRLEEAWDWSPNIILVAVPTNMHIPVALEAAKHGCHLFIEKPLSHTFEGVQALCAEVERRQLVTMVACNMRFHPGPATVKRLMAGGLVGQVIAGRIQAGSFLPRWRPTQDYRQSYSASPESGGAILDCIHEIDLALWYFGEATVQAAAHLPARSIGLETEGLAEILLAHDSGTLSSVHLNFIQQDYRRCCQIIGADGTIYWDFADRRVSVWGPEARCTRTYPEPDGWQLNQMYLDEMAHFLHAVSRRAQTSNPLAGGLAALRVALTAREMGDKGVR